eukprot:802264-Rhodomonas_salina.2
MEGVLRKGRNGGMDVDASSVGDEDVACCPTATRATQRRKPRRRKVPTCLALRPMPCAVLTYGSARVPGAHKAGSGRYCSRTRCPVLTCRRYAVRPTQCPVLTKAAYAMSGTDVGCPAVPGAAREEEIDPRGPLCEWGTESLWQSLQVRGCRALEIKDVELEIKAVEPESKCKLPPSQHSLDQEVGGCRVVGAWCPCMSGKHDGEVDLRSFPAGVRVLRCQTTGVCEGWVVGGV